MPEVDRRTFGAGIASAGTSMLLSASSSLAAEPPPEVRTIRVPWTTAICFAPVYVVDAFLRAEGFDGITYVKAPGGGGTAEMVRNREIDFGITFTGMVVHVIDAGWPITAIGGLHVGCYELFAHEPVLSIGDLKGRRVGISRIPSSDYLYISMMARNIGLDPQKDIAWVTNEDGGAMEAFAAGETDAYLAFPPAPQKLRGLGAGRVILNTTLDHPWSQYICCMQYAHRDFVRENPVATKRFLRAMYRAAEFCRSDPDGAARQLVDGGFEQNYGYALETIRNLPYDLWRDYDSEDTMRFHALLLHEAGMLNNSPNKVIADGSDWRFLDELKREMKA